MVPGWAPPDGKFTDEVAVSAPRVLKSHMGEDAAETLRYGGSHTIK